uniref:(northern house mosquito) hypothetical protein n=1 Tax=Culex pipiens TaxID=7175 RepID=A0A8D8IWZ4_CULPI
MEAKVIPLKSRLEFMSTISNALCHLLYRHPLRVTTVTFGTRYPQRSCVPGSLTRPARRRSRCCKHWISIWDRSCYDSLLKRNSPRDFAVGRVVPDHCTSQLGRQSLGMFRVKLST